MAAPIAAGQSSRDVIDLARERDRQPILEALETSDQPALMIYARLDRMRVEDARRAK